MDQFSNNDQSGMVGFLVGIIVLVFAGIAISLMADKRFSFSNNRITLEDTIEEERHELIAAKARLESARDHWRRECEPLVGQRGNVESISARVRAAEARLSSLRKEKAEAAAALAAVSGAFEDYRSRFRQQIRGEANGEQMAELRSRSGRTYKDVTITRVSSAGIEFRHDQGISRLLPEDLEPLWHDRFQWTRDEISRILDQEKAMETLHNERDAKGKIKNEPEPPTNKKKKKKSEPDANELRIDGLRDEVLDSRKRLNAALSEAANARSQAAMNRGRSVPGSLETWEQRASRLDSSATKIRAQYMTARGRLASVSPKDVLLLDER